MKGAHSLTDRVVVCGTTGPSSILGGRAKNKWRGAGVVYLAALEKRARCKPYVGSNPTLSALAPVA